MYCDKQTRLGTAQALSASGAITDVYDCGGDFDIGAGTPMAMVFTVTTAADFTTGDETYTFAARTDDNSSMSSPTTMISAAVVAGNLKVGDQVVLPLINANERYIGGYLTLAGTTPSVSVTTDIVPLANAPKKAAYPSGFSVG